MHDGKRSEQDSRGFHYFAEQRQTVIDLMQINTILRQLEQWAPRSLQEDYDNAGLIVGNAAAEATGVVVSLDSTEDVVDEAIRKGANLVVAHHPILFGKKRSLTGRDYVERTLLKAIKHDIALYAIHTNLDNIRSGVNARICEVLGIQSPRILSPKSGLLNKLVVYVPHVQADAVRDALFAAGAGAVGDYTECSFGSQGAGTFKGGEGTDPHVGQVGQRHTEPETRLEVLVENWNVGAVLAAMQQAHPYEEVAYDLFALKNVHHQVGAGMVGELEQPMTLDAFLAHVKQVLGTGSVRHTAAVAEQVQRIAVCGGSGSFLLEDAVRAGADVFVTADYKYHQFFDADGRIVIADVGHFESEQYTVDLLGEFLREKFPNFAVHLSDTQTNPIKYF